MSAPTIVESVAAVERGETATVTLNSETVRALVSWWVAQERLRPNLHAGEAPDLAALAALTATEAEAAAWRAVGVAMRPALVPETWYQVRAAPGRSKNLVVGSHDVSCTGWLRVEGFHQVKAVLTSPGDPPLIRTHALLPNVPDGHVNIHGHRHEIIGPPDAPHINVSVEQIEYRSISLVRLRRLAQAIHAGEGPEGDTTRDRVREGDR